MIRTYQITTSNFELSEEDEEKIKTSIDAFKFIKTVCRILCHIRYHNELFTTRIRLEAPAGRLIIANRGDTNVIVSAQAALEVCFEELNRYYNNKLTRTSHATGIISSKVVKL